MAPSNRAGDTTSTDATTAEDGASPAGRVVPCLTTLDEAAIQAHLDAERFFWLDLVEPSGEDLTRMGRIFGFHPLAVEDSQEFHQRPKLDDYGDYVLLVFYGAWREGPGQAAALHEVHLFISGRYVVTIHREPLAPLERQRELLEGRKLQSEQFLLYRILDTLTDTYFPILSDVDDEIDELESQLLAGPNERCLERLFALKREIVAMRKVVTPQRDLFARSIDQIAELPGLQLDQRDYFRDVYDHLIRISDLMDSYRDLLSGATDLYLSSLANQQNEVMKRLTLIATVFLPLSFITGFFGMNFGYMVTHLITREWVFWVVGVGSMAATLVGFVIYFRRKGWM